MLLVAAWSGMIWFYWEGSLELQTLVGLVPPVLLLPFEWGLNGLTGYTGYFVEAPLFYTAPGGKGGGIPGRAEGNGLGF